MNEASGGTVSGGGVGRSGEGRKRLRNFFKITVISTHTCDRPSNLSSSHSKDQNYEAAKLREKKKKKRIKVKGHHRHGIQTQIAYLWGSSRAGADSAEVVEADHDQEIVPIEEVESENDRILGVIEKGHHVQIHGAHHHRDTSQNHQETHLKNTPSGPSSSLSLSPSPLPIPRSTRSSRIFPDKAQRKRRTTRRGGRRASSSATRRGCNISSAGTETYAPAL